MNETYDINKLIIGQIYICVQNGRFPLETTYNQLYIFYEEENIAKKVVSNKNVKEIFTDDEFEIYTKGENTHDHKFKTPYVVNTKPITAYLTEKEKESKVITKWRLLEIYNEINFDKKNNKQKNFKRQLQK